MLQLIHDDFQNVQGLAVDSVITDPPYGNFYGSQRKKIKEALVGGDDLKWLDVFGEWVFGACPTGPVIVFCDRHCRSQIETELKRHANFLNDAVWFKRPWGIGYNFRPAHEHILLFSKSKSIKASHYGLSSVLQANKVGKKKHPTEKPVALMKQLVLGLTNPGDVVLDPFMGVASTGVAAIKNGRSFVGIELEENYVKIGRNRLEEIQV